MGSTAVMGSEGIGLAAQPVGARYYLKQLPVAREIELRLAIAEDARMMSLELHGPNERRHMARLNDEGEMDTTQPLLKALNTQELWLDLQQAMVAYIGTDRRVKFAIRSGELVFSLKGATAPPLRARRFITKLPINATIKHQETLGLSELSFNKMLTKRGTYNDVVRIQSEIFPGGLVNETSFSIALFSF